MKRSVSLLGILCLFVSFSVQAQYTNIQTWGQKLYYNGSDYLLQTAFQESHMHQNK